MANLGYSFYPTHPGDILKEELECRNVSQRSFAMAGGILLLVVGGYSNGVI